MVTEIEAWHARTGTVIEITGTPNQDQRREIEWRVCTGQAINVTTLGPRDAFHVSSVLLFGGTMEVMIIMPLWMWHGVIPKVIPVWTQLMVDPAGVYRHQSW